LSTHSRQPGAKALGWFFFGPNATALVAQLRQLSGTKIRPKNRTDFLREVSLKIVFDPDQKSDHFIPKQEFSKHGLIRSLSACSRWIFTPSRLKLDPSGKGSPG